MRFQTKLALVMTGLVAVSLGGMAFTLMRQAQGHIEEMRRRHGERVVHVLSLGHALSQRIVGHTQAHLAATAAAAGELAPAGVERAGSLERARARANATGAQPPILSLGAPPGAGVNDDWVAAGDTPAAFVSQTALQNLGMDMGLRPFVELILQAPDAIGAAIINDEGVPVLHAGPGGEPVTRPVPPEAAAFAVSHLSRAAPGETRSARFGSEGVMTLTIPHPGGDGRAALLYRYNAEGGLLIAQGSAAALIWTEAAIALAASLLAALWLSRGLSRPIERLATGVQDYGAGHLSRRVDAGRRAPREVRRLSSAFNTMADAIQQSMADIERETRQREQLESELRIAATLQQEMLPGEPYESPRLELTGWSLPARQVGGDFYDYAALGGGRLGVAIGDATDKGLPAALLVTECWSACEALFAGSESPAEILGRVNQVMRARLKNSGRFVTLLFFSIHEETREVRFASAGHNPPYLIRADGRVEALRPEAGFPIGIVEPTIYAESRLICEPGDALVLYTDGLTDAHRDGGDLYGEQRLAAALERQGPHSATALATAVRSGVEAHTGGAEPYDDMTFVAIRFK